MTNTNVNREAESWVAESLRFTCFLAVPLADEAYLWWEKLVGEKPEASVTRADVGLRQQEGAFGLGRLKLVILPGRIDWYLNAAASEQRAEEIVPTLGPFLSAVDSLRPLLHKWLPDAPAMTRIALGAVLIRPVPDLAAGYRVLSDYLHAVKVDPGGSSELSYTINRARQSTSISSLRINRLCKWSVLSMQTVTLDVGSTQAISDKPRYACRLELDMNTAGNVKDALPRSQLALVFEELVTLGEEIARKGDIP